MERKDGALRIGKPLFCDIIIAHRCFFKCQMCIEWKTPLDSDLPMLSFEQCKQFIDELAEFIDYSLDINIMGGEPFAIEWLLSLCDYMHKKGFNPIISTNAYLIDEAMAKKIAASHLKVLAISLDSTEASIHDAIRGKAGAFDHVMRALSYLNKYRSRELHLVILPLILDSNLETLPDLVKWVQESKQADSVSFLALVESGLVNPKEGWFNKPEYRNIWPHNPDRTKKVIESIIDMKQHGYPVTNPYNQLEAFKDYYSDPEKFLNRTEYCIRDYVIDFDPNADILLSGHKLGSIKENTPLKRLWFSSKANEIRKYIDEHGCVNSRSCLINFICAFLKQEEQKLIYCAKRAYAYQQNGEYSHALVEFKKAVALKPEDGKLRLGTAYNYFKLNDYEAALKEYDEAFRISPETHTTEVDLQYKEIQFLQAEKVAKCKNP